MNHFFRNPHVLVTPLEGGFSHAKNPLISNGEQILNRFQASVLSLVDQATTAGSLASRLDCTIDSVSLALQSLAASQLVSTSSDFSQPKTVPAGEALSLWIHTSNACNLGCPYCYVNAARRGPRMGRGTIDSLKRKILLQTANGQLKRLTLKIAGGEPLLTFRQWRDDIAEIKETLESRGIDVNLHLLTNGTTLGSEILSYLTQHDVAVGISIDGVNETHDASRSFSSGRGSFSVVERNLGLLENAGVKPYVTTVVTSSNIDGLPELTTWLLGRNLGFRFSLEKGGDLEESLAVPILAHCYEIIEGSLPGYTEFLSHTLCDLSFTKPLAETSCGVGRSRASVNVNGAVHTCQTEHDEEPIGHLFEERSLVDLIVSSPLRPTLVATSEDCQICPYRHICAGGCPTQKVNGKSPYCHTFHALIPVILRLRGLTMLEQLQRAN